MLLLPTNPNNLEETDSDWLICQVSYVLDIANSSCLNPFSVLTSPVVNTACLNGPGL